MPFYKFNNLSLHYQEYGTAEKTLLFIHGLGGNGAAWKYQIEYFKKDYHIVTVDLFGHGQSTKGIDPVTAPRLDAEAIDDLMRREIGKSYVAIGHSFATFILPELVKLGDPNLRGAVFVDCTYAGFEEVIKDRTEFAKKMLAIPDTEIKEAATRWYRDMIGPADDREREFIISSLEYCNPQWLFKSVAGCREYCRLYPPQETPIKENLPILIMEAENAVGGNFQKSWVNHFKEAQYYLVEKGYHFFFITDHDLFDRRLNLFLSESF
jgi:pimeloyl-ACP methyl ester carboxylesterase